MRRALNLQRNTRQTLILGMTAYVTLEHDKTGRGCRTGKDCVTWGSREGEGGRESSSHITGRPGFMIGGKRCMTNGVKAQAMTNDDDCYKCHTRTQQVMSFS